MQTRLISIVFLVAATSAGLAADDWKIYRFPQDGFAVDFPSPVTPQDQKPDAKRMVRHNQYWSDQGEVAFGVSASHFHHKVIVAEAPDKVLKGVIERVRGSLECTVRSQRELSFPGATVREIIFEKCKKLSGGVAKQRVLLAGDWIYQVMVLGTKPGIEASADTKRFLESFSLTAR